MSVGVVVIGEAECAPNQYGVGPNIPTCIWLGAPPDAASVERSELKSEDPESPLLSFREALALLKVSRNTLYRLIHAGKIPGVRRVGRAWRFHRASLTHWLSCTGQDSHGKRRRR